MILLYLLLLIARSEVSSRRLLEQPADNTPAREHGVLLRPARKLAAGSSLSKVAATEQAALLSLNQALAPADAAKLQWQPDTNHCNWQGVYCTDDKHVYLIDLSNQAISGTLSEAVDLSALQELQSIWLQGNQLAGTLPASWFSLPKLRELLLYDNAIEGSLLADALAATTGLRRLNLNDNKLTGTLPDAVSALSNLEALQLATNNLQGTVPAAFAGLSKLKTLALHDNPQLSGCIPAALTSKQRPVRLEADESQAAGAAPDPALANTRICGFCSSTCTDPEMAAAQAAAAAPSSSNSVTAAGSTTSPSPSSGPDASGATASPSPAVADTDAAVQQSPSPAPSTAAQPDADDTNASAQTSVPEGSTQAAAAAGAAEAAAPAAAGDAAGVAAAAAAAGTAVGAAAAPEQPAILPLDGTPPAAATAGGAAGTSTKGNAAGAPVIVPGAAGSNNVKIDPNLMVLEDDVQGKTQVYMEFERHPSYVAASASSGARRRRVLM